MRHQCPACGRARTTDEPADKYYTKFPCPLCEQPEEPVSKLPEIANEAQQMMDAFDDDMINLTNFMGA